MTKKAKSPGRAWSELLDDNEDLYKRSRPKRAIFILDYLKEHCRALSIQSYHEQGAFSGKDIKYIKSIVVDGDFYASDLDSEVAGYLGGQGVDALACDAFSLPFKDGAFDLTFHSGLIVCFDNDDALSILQEQLRTTAKIAFIFAHNELSWIDKVASFYKRKVKRNDIFNYRRYGEAELLEMAEKMGVGAQIHYFDNALVNFVERNFGRFDKILSFLRLIDRKMLFNEIVMVVIK